MKKPAEMKMIEVATAFPADSKVNVIKFWVEDRRCDRMADTVSLEVGDSVEEKDEARSRP